MKDDFETEDFCTAVFDEFFFTCINIDNVVRHLIRSVSIYKWGIYFLASGCSGGCTPGYPLQGWRHC